MTLGEINKNIVDFNFNLFINRTRRVALQFAQYPVVYTVNIHHIHPNSWEFVPDLYHSDVTLGNNLIRFRAICPKKQELAVHKMSLTNMFTDHPESVGESYFGHMGFAARISFSLFLAAFAALVHAILPFLFETTASRILSKLHEKTAHRGSDAAGAQKA